MDTTESQEIGSSAERSERLHHSHEATLMSAEKWDCCSAPIPSTEHCDECGSVYCDNCGECPRCEE